VHYTTNICIWQLVDEEKVAPATIKQTEVSKDAPAAARSHSRADKLEFIEPFFVGRGHDPAGRASIVQQLISL
jgi:hypothetical protein